MNAVDVVAQVLGKHRLCWRASQEYECTCAGSSSNPYVPDAFKAHQAQAVVDALREAGVLLSGPNEKAGES